MKENKGSNFKLSIKEGKDANYLADNSMNGLNIIDLTITKVYHQINPNSKAEYHSNNNNNKNRKEKIETETELKTKERVSPEKSPELRQCWLMEDDEKLRQFWFVWVSNFCPFYLPILPI
ncbi:hypothetical protein H5410_000609 [Solanum commersonii]|uniref:Uncharacterized protein n=1 Tax=Solanum commersonii TaxID=4109 RepID=A0A9J6AWP8_SOLCO|nr:hypothetical protein H5410_000609 [Solanum commersonii]